MNDAEKMVTAIRELNRTLKECAKRLEQQNLIFIEAVNKITELKNEKSE